MSKGNGALGVLANVFTYNSAIHAFGKCEQWQQALALLAETRSVDLERDVITYNAAISACEKCEQRRLALGLLAELRSVNVETNVAIDSAAINASEKSNGILKVF